MASLHREFHYEANFDSQLTEPLLIGSASLRVIYLPLIMFR